MRLLILLIGLNILVNCTNAKEQPLFLQAELTNINEWSTVTSDTLIFDTFYDINKVEDVIISQANSIVEVSDKKFWVADYLGKVVELNEKGEFSKSILQNGKGPSEILKPLGLAKGVNNTVLAVDGGQQILIKLDATGKEINRISTPSISTISMVDNPLITSSNSIIWNKVLHSDYALIEWDSTGNFKQGLVKNIIPPGKQPIMLNSLAYDYNLTKKRLVYAFKGLPVLFIKDDNQTASAINLDTDIQKNDLEKLIEVKTDDGSNGVKTKIKGVFITNNATVAAIQNQLLYIPNKTSSDIIKYELLSTDRETIKFHYVNKTENHLFLIDVYNRKIYRTSISQFL